MKQFAVRTYLMYLVYLVYLVIALFQLVPQNSQFDCILYGSAYIHSYIQYIHSEGHNSGASFL